MIRAGRNRRRIVIQRRVETNTKGSVDWTWQTATDIGDQGAVWCSIEALRGRELFAAQQVQSEITGVIRLRYMPGISAKMRAYEAASQTYYDFASAPVPNPRRTEMQIFYTVRDADGWRE